MNVKVTRTAIILSKVRRKGKTEEEIIKKKKKKKKKLMYKNVCTQ